MAKPLVIETLITEESRTDSLGNASSLTKAKREERKKKGKGENSVSPSRDPKYYKLPENVRNAIDKANEKYSKTGKTQFYHKLK